MAYNFHQMEEVFKADAVRAASKVLLKLFVITCLFIFPGLNLQAQQPQGKSETQYSIERIEIVGNRRIESAKLWGCIISRVGDAYNDDAVRRDEQAIRDTGFFENVRVEVEESPHKPSAKIIAFIVRERPLSEYCAELKIAPDFRVAPSHCLSGEPTTGSFYVFDYLGTGLTTVDHFQKKLRAESPVRLLYLETDANQILDRTVKTFQILKGPFGAVYVEKSCFYTRPIESTYSFVSVHSYFKHPIVEVPSELSRGPESLPPLTSLSLIRVFRAPPEYLVVVANYEPNGEVGSLHIDGAKDGDWVHSSLVPASGLGFVHRIPNDHSSEALRKYGIPERIDVEVFLRSHQIPLAKVSLPEEVVVLNLHYGYNTVIQQNELANGATVRVRFLQPSVAEEETVLNPHCESHFKQQSTLGLPTVQ